MQAERHSILIAKKKTFFFILFPWFISVCFALLTDVYWILVIPLLIPLVVYLWKDFSRFYYLLLIAVPFSTEFLFNETTGTDLPDEPMMLIMSGFVLMLLFYQPKFLSRRLVFHPLMLLLYVLAGWMLVTVVASTLPVVSFKYFLAKCWYILAFVFGSFLFLRRIKDFINAGLALVIPVIMIVLICLLRFVQYDFAFASVNDTVQPFFRNHVNYGAMLVCMMPVGGAFYFLSQRRRIKRAAIILMIVALAGLVFSYSRGAWLALIIGFVAWWGIKRNIIHYLYGLVLVAVVAIFAWFSVNNRYLEYKPDYNTTVFHPNFGEHMRATYELKDVSTIERFYRWIAGVRMSNQHMLTGYGPNTFADNYKPYTVKYFRTWVSKNEDRSTVHNYFLLLLTEQGIPGFIFFVLLTGCMLYYAQRLYHRLQNKFFQTVSLVTGIILSMILVVNFLSDLIETDKIGSLFFLVLAVLIIIDVKRKNGDLTA